MGPAVGAADEGGGHPGPAAARPRADGRAVLAGRGACGRAGGRGSVPRPVAADVGGRDGAGRAGHAGEPGGLRHRGERRPVPEGPAGHGLRVRVAGPVLAAMGPSAAKGSGEQSLARTLYPRLEEGWLLLADRLFYGWDDWRAAAGSGADLLWRVRDELGLPCLELLPDGSYRSVLMKASIRGARRDGLTGAARRGEDPGPALARHVRVVEYEVTDRDGEDALITLVTTITDWQAAPAAALASAYHERWQHETANAQFRPSCAAPGRILRSGGLELVRQEIWGYLLTAWAVSALICDAAPAAWTGPGRVSFTKAVRIVRRAIGPAFPPSAG